MVDVDREAVRAGELDGQDLGARQGSLDLGRDLTGQLSLLVVCGCHRSSPVIKNGPAGPFREPLEMWCQQDSKRATADPPARQSNTIVTGPSFTSSTAIRAPKTPRST